MNQSNLNHFLVKVCFKISTIMSLIGFLVSGCGVVSVDLTANPLATALTAATDCTNSKSYSDFGAGSIGSPYLICNADQLASIGKDSTAWGANFKLTADIDMSAYDGSTAAKSVSPIGVYNISATTGVAFTGAFDGNNHTISNLKVTQVSAYSSGLFGYTNGASIFKLNLSGINITGPGYVGGLVGLNKNTKIHDINISGTVTQTGTTYYYSGGLIGYNDGSGTGSDASITTIFDTVTVNGFDSVGGLIGWNSAVNGGKANISFVDYNGTITGTAGGNTFGGIIGMNKADTGGSANLSDCQSAGSWTSTNGGSFSGGLVGTHWITGSGSVGSVTNCYSTMTITSPTTFNAGIMGGLVGMFTCASSATCNVTTSYYSGTITLTSGSTSAKGYLGGLIGYQNLSTGTSTSTVTDCFANGTIRLQNPSYPAVNIGGLIGSAQSSNGSTIYYLRTYSDISFTGSFVQGSTGGFAGNVLVASGSSFLSSSSNYWNSTKRGVGIGTFSNSGTYTTPTALSDSAMLSQNNFTGWDFTNVWTSVPGSTKPSLIFYPWY